MPSTAAKLFATVALATLVSACASTPEESPAVAAGETAADAASEAVPELTLNLPQQNECACELEEPADYTFLEKGFDALLDGEYIEAVQYFQRYQRLESSPKADWEAGIAIAYVSMLPRSPFYDPQAARKSFMVLREQNAKELKVHDKTRLMRQSILNFLVLQTRIDTLRAGNATLKEDLEKREEALKRLRELTLGQKAVTP